MRFKGESFRCENGLELMRANQTKAISYPLTNPLTILRLKEEEKKKKSKKGISFAHRHPSLADNVGVTAANADVGGAIRVNS